MLTLLTTEGGLKMRDFWNAALVAELRALPLGTPDADIGTQRQSQCDERWFEKELQTNEPLLQC